MKFNNVNNLRFLLNEESDDSDDVASLNDETKSEEKDSTDFDDPFSTDTDEKEDDKESESIDLEDDKDDDSTTSSSSSDDDEVSDLANKVSKNLEKLQKSLELGDELSPPNNVVKKITTERNSSVLKKMLKIKHFIFEADIGKATKKLQDFQSALEDINNPLEDLLGRSKELNIEKIANNCANLILDFDKLDPIEIITYFGKRHIILNSAGIKKEEIDDRINEFNRFLEYRLEELGYEVKNKKFTLDNSNYKISVGSMNNSGG